MSITISISENDLKIISVKRKTEQKVKFLRRYQCLWMVHEQYFNKDIANMLGINIDTVTDWIKIYNKAGLAGLGLLNYAGRRPSQLDKVKDTIIETIKNRNISTIKDLQTILVADHKINIEHSWLFRYCKKNSICLIKTQD